MFTVQFASAASAKLSVLAREKYQYFWKLHPFKCKSSVGGEMYISSYQHTTVHYIYIKSWTKVER